MPSIASPACTTTSRLLNLRAGSPPAWKISSPGDVSSALLIDAARQKAAVYRQDDAVEIGDSVRGQKHRRARDLFRFAEPPLGRSHQEFHPPARLVEKPGV